ncbi:Unannotated [Lentimonas sp. CC19]|nr:Unannotated [Lentimonas sp. CC10]CAA6695352.1 Unannotated [Lentimonas sp. CC19]CAA7068817.1 Unannotated [Lentimonas sp. CC11]
MFMLKKLLWLIPLCLVACKSAPVEIARAQDEEHLVLQLAVLKTSYDTDDAEQLLLKHDSVYEFPALKLIKDDYANFDIVADDGQYSMKVTSFGESGDEVHLGLKMQRRIKVDELTYGVGSESVTTPIYEKEGFDTERVYQKDQWYILGRSYNKRKGEVSGSGVYFVLRVNSRSSQR